jgi:hypothetical protein
MVKSSGNTFVRTFASYSPDKGKLFVYLLNTSGEEQTVNLDIQHPGEPSLRFVGELAGEGPGDVNPVWKELLPWKDPLKFTLESTSITVLDYCMN